MKNSWWMCDKMRWRVMAAAGVALLFTLSLYYQGGGWGLRKDPRLYLPSSSFFRRAEVKVTPATDWYDPAEESSQFVLNTVGCKIPNMKVDYMANMSAYYPVCGERFADLTKINETHAQFTLPPKWKKHFDHCTFKFAHRSTTLGKNINIKYSTPDIKFSQNITFELEGDFIRLTCFPTQHNTNPSEDTFAVVKKRNMPNDTNNIENKAWNVLVIGMDTMSRARMLDSMHRTVSYFHHSQWIDFKGYQKIASNTWPNLMAVLTGMKLSTTYTACKGPMDACNHLLMWSKYREAGYVTAYGEDYVSLPDTFAAKGYKNPPTDHYMRPFFLTGEHIRKMGTNLTTVCTGTKSSSEHILDYALDFSETYKNHPFFGFFWINSNSHNVANLPEAIDDKLTNTFKRLKDIGILDNTFIVFLSDHGVRFGSKRTSVESYYDERLPALFMWAPIAFREEFNTDFENLRSNRLRLVTPYDLYLTLDNILRISSGSKYSTKSEACPKCQSLFSPIASERTCREASVEENWCTCHSVERMMKNDTEGVASVMVVLHYIQDFASHLDLRRCTKCERFKLHSIMRMHYYYSSDKSVKYMVVAFVVIPGHVGYEATVALEGTKYEIVGQISIISPHFGNGYCVKRSSVSMFCYCTKEKKCK